MKTVLAAATAWVLLAGAVSAHEHEISERRIPHLDHVIVIMMENHKAGQIIGNPANAPFLNEYAARVNVATNYWAVGHPSLTNYLEVVGGSNFGVTDDFWPDWSSGGCVDNNPAGSGCAGAVTPIEGTGTDVAFPLTVDPTTDPQIGPLPPGTVPVPNNWSIVDYPAAPYVAKTIADQLVERGHTWKTYQESLPGTGPRVDGVNYADGTYSNLSPVAAFQVGGANKAVAKLYAVKHNPFVYFRNIQQGSTPELSFARVVDFDGPHGLFADLARGALPTFSFVAPNQCHDMHGAGGDPDGRCRRQETGRRDQGVAFLAGRSQRDRGAMGRERLRQRGQQGRLPGRDQLWQASRGQRPSVQPLFADPDPGGRVRAALPEPCVRPVHRRDGRSVRGRLRAGLSRAGLPGLQTGLATRLANQPCSVARAPLTAGSIKASWPARLAHSSMT
jgi:hypothetical protein